MGDQSVRIATSADAPSIVSLRGFWEAERGDVITADFADELAEWMIAHPQHVCALAFDEDRAIGMAWLAIVDRVPRPSSFTRRSGDVQSVFVLPEFRRSGVATALMSALDEVAQSRGLAHLSVHSSPMAVPLYESIGFAATPLLMRKPPSAGA